jgi:membrane associated rhomboid family serine protease
MRSGNIQDQFSFWVFKDKIPVTKLIILANAITFLIIIFRLEALVRFLQITNDLPLSMRPWTFFTYPLIGAYDFISLVFSCLWLWFAGGSLERSWGSRVYAFYFFIMSAISALGLLIGSMLISVPMPPLAGLWLPLAGATVAFAMLNPEQQILFFFIIPMKLKYLALIDAGIVFFMYAGANIILGVFALSGCAASYWYARYGREYGRRPRRFEDRDKVVRLYRKPSLVQRLNPVRWIKDRREKKKLKDFFDKSGLGE